MSDLKLLPPNQPTPLERLLLDAASSEAPSAEQRQRVRAALGLPALAVLAPPPSLAVGRRAALLKATAGGLAIVSVAALLWFSGVGRTQQQQPSVAALVPKAATAQPVLVARAAEPAPLPAAEANPELAPAPATAQTSAQTSKRTTQGTRAALPAGDSAADLSEQLRLIEAARAAIARGDAASAASALSSYGSRFPRGAFGQEASVLRIETLDLQGNHAQASAQAKRFLAGHPNSPHVGVVQRIADR